jgi:hypothetical protein
MERGEIAEHRVGFPPRPNCHPYGTGDQTIDAAEAAIAEHTQALISARKNRVEISDWHAVADK